ncbi:MAG: MerR family transcriptional regulator [Nocardioides sp.]|uniref:MerR family transcriptional regulator n=1 Tax=Nocardioides sp. TaxID=35761 RepID=UPI003F0CC5F9
MFTIKRAAELVGVSEATLRAWERRYGIGAPARSESGYRLYDDAAVRDLTRMQALVMDGWSAREAAAEALALRDAPVPRASAAAGGGPTEPDLGALARAATTLDAQELARLLDERFAGGSFETVVDSWLLPALDRLGAGWEAGELTVAGEHFVAHGVTRRLAAAYEAAGDNPTGPRVLIGLPPGARHDLGLLSFATAARRAGLSTRYLGADVPVAAWAHAASDSSVSAAVLAVPMASDAPALERTVEALLGVRPDLLVAVGGAAQELAPAACLLLGHSVPRAAAELVLRTPRAARR